jgi:hypothetical protein
MDYYIIATRKGGLGESDISHYMYNTNQSASGDIVTKSYFRSIISLTFDRFYSYNIKKGTKVECEWYKSSRGESYLKSDPNGTEQDNLLELPSC